MNRRELLTGLGVGGLFAVTGTHAAHRADPPAASGPSKLTVEDLVRLLVKDAINPTRVYGHEVTFVGVLLSIDKGVDGGRVPRVRIEGWDRKRDLYGTAYVHNVIPDHLGKVGDRVRVRALIVEHGYGTLSLWCYHWARQDA